MNEQKFFLYARKSTDVENKQVRSIEDQITELRAFAKLEKLEIVEELIEKQSAKIPGRPIFNSMISELSRARLLASFRGIQTDWRAIPWTEAKSSI